MGSPDIHTFQMVVRRNCLVRDADGEDGRDVIVKDGTDVDGEKENRPFNFKRRKTLLVDLQADDTSADKRERGGEVTPMVQHQAREAEENAVHAQHGMQQAAMTAQEKEAAYQATCHKRIADVKELFNNLNSNLEKIIEVLTTCLDQAKLPVLAPM